MESLSSEIYSHRVKIYSIFLGLFVYVVYAAYSMRIFYPDGTIFFSHILEVVKPVHWHWDRQFAYYVQHTPLISAIKLGIRDIPTLAKIHTAWYFSFGLISLVSCWFILPNNKKSFFIFPLFWMFGMYMNTEFFPITPGRLVSAIFWMIFLLAIFRSSWWSLLLVALIGWPTLRIYQGMLILGPVLAFISLWKAAILKEQNRVKAGFWILFGLYFLAGAILSFISVLNPQDKTSFVTFVAGFLLIVDEEFYPHWPLFLSMFVFGFLGWGFFRKKFFYTQKHRFTSIFYVFALLVLLMPLIWPESLAPETHQQVRSLNIYAAALLAIVAFFVNTGSLKPDIEWYRLALKTGMILAVVQIGWALQATHQWNKYLGIFQHELAELSPGLHLAQETSLLDLNGNYRMSNGMHNDWDTALMSVLFSPKDSVKVIISHAYGNIYYPVDPYSKDDMPNFSAYGVTLESYFKALSEQDTVLVPDRPLPEIFKWFSTETVGENDFFEN